MEMAPGIGRKPMGRPGAEYLESGETPAESRARFLARLGRTRQPISPAGNQLQPLPGA